MMRTPAVLASARRRSHWRKKRHWTAFQKRTSPASWSRAAASAAGSRWRSGRSQVTQEAPPCASFSAMKRA